MPARSQPDSSVAAPPGADATELAVNGMNCQSCVRHVTEALETVPGVAAVAVDLSAGRARVRWRPGVAPTTEPLLRAVKDVGFDASIVLPSAAVVAAPVWSPLAGWRFNVVFGGLATLPLMAGEWAFGLGSERWFQWLAFALALPVQVLCGARFYRGAWRQLRARAANMDTLVALGSTTAFAYSAWLLLSGTGGHAYFMEAAAIITLISLGHWLEARMSARAASSLRALLELAPPTARRLGPDGTEREVPAAALQVHDRIVLRPGDRVPTDGEVVEGGSAVDEAMLTGEARPVEKTVGSPLYGGTVNQSGRLVLRVTATGAATALAQIIAVVQHAQTSRAQIQKLGDRVSAVFVPVVVLAAIVTGLWWGLAFASAQSVSTALAPWLWPVSLPATAWAAAFIHAAAVLIVACPCAMGLATPAAIMAGTNAAARRGILIRDGAALEKSGRITAVLFDKTGTLTRGALTIAATTEFGAGRGQPAEVAALATALARGSAHPLSRAVVAASGRDSGAGVPACLSPPGVPPGEPALPRPDAGKTTADGATARPVPTFRDWREVRGSGVEALDGGATVRLGSLTWLGECGVDLGPAGTFTSAWSAQGATILGLARGRELLGALALRDGLKADAAAVVRTLGTQGKQVFLVTGDQPATAAVIAREAGIAAENVFAAVRPERKAEIVRALQARGARVAFVGDGINDAPALEQADLGVAVSRASDVAREAADILLLRPDLAALPEALGLAQATLRTIRQNLFWAFFYNAAAVPLAALGFLSPVLCAAAMGLSDVIVIGNALRLARWK